jgi:flavorubredoxin
MERSNTTISLIGDDLYRISTPVSPDVVPGGFSFNQYLLVDEAPLLVHTGLRRMYEVVSQAIETVMPLQNLRYICFCHVEAENAVL